MNQGNRALLFIATISALVDYMEGHSVDLSDLKEILPMLGFDTYEILSLHPIVAIQKICKEFGEMNITKAVLDQMDGEIDE